MLLFKGDIEKKHKKRYKKVAFIFYNFDETLRSLCYEKYV